MLNRRKTENPCKQKLTFSVCKYSVVQYMCFDVKVMFLTPNLTDDDCRANPDSNEVRNLYSAAFCQGGGMSKKRVMNYLCTLQSLAFMASLN